MTEEINIACVSDQGYASCMIVMISSLLINHKSNLPISFYIIDCGIKEEDKAVLVDLINRFRCKIEFIQGDYTKCLDFKSHGHFCHAAYLKIQLPTLLSKRGNLFLDCDLIVLNDIKELWTKDIDNTYLYAVGNPVNNYDGYLVIPKGSKIFNSGVMLINLDKWRNEKVEEKALYFLKENSYRLTLHDQTALNVLLYDKWLSLAPKWNMQNSFYYSNNRHICYSKDEINEAIKSPSIIHFTTNSKPWQFRNAHPYKNKFIEYHINVFGSKPKYRDLGMISFLKIIKEMTRYI